MRTNNKIIILLLVFCSTFSFTKGNGNRPKGKKNSKNSQTNPFGNNGQRIVCSGKIIKIIYQTDRNKIQKTNLLKNHRKRKVIKNKKKLIVILRTNKGTFYVHLGSNKYLKENNFYIQKGDKIKVETTKGTYQYKSSIFASILTKKEKTLLIFDSTPKIREPSNKRRTR